MGPPVLSSPRAPESPSTRHPKLSVDVKFRLAAGDLALLQQIAEEECGTVSQVLRRMVRGELRRYSDPLALARAGARDGTVQVS